MLALSVRQPWASFFFADHPNAKKIENRTWPTDHRGWLLIHAARSCSEKEYEEGRQFALRCGLTQIKPYDRLRRGGIVGMVYVCGCVRKFSSPWFVGPWGWLFRDPYPLPFQECAGQKGLFVPGELKVKHDPLRGS